MVTVISWAILLFVIVAVLVGATSDYTLLTVPEGGHFSARLRPGVILGSNQSGIYSPIGWLMPADTRISTSYIANQTFDGNYMNAYVTVLSNSSYQLQPGTTLSIGLYINGLLMGTKTCLTDDPTGTGGWTIYGTGSNSHSSLTTYEGGVTLFKTPFPAGTMLTVTVWSNHSVWIQVYFSDYRLVRNFQHNIGR